MDILTFLGFVALIHAAFYFTDHLLRSCMNVPYIYFLENTGITVRPLQLHLFTTAFNRMVTKWATWRPRLVRAWFTVGAVVVLLLLLPTIVILVGGLYNHFRPAPEKTVQVLQPMLPGVNIPVQELPYYFLTLLVASVIHEVGHAIAAIKEDVRVIGFGFLLLFIFPGAFVDVPTEEIKSLSPFRQLKILCAGVWHNVVLVLMGLGVALSAPYILHPFYVHGRGLTVMAITQNSPARGPMGLELGDMITAVNKWPVSSVGAWQQRLVHSIRADQVGFCVAESVVHTYDETIHHAFEGADGSVQCCSGDSDAHLCFELQEDRDADDGVSSMHPFACLPARIALSMSTQTCITSASCPSETHCLAPSLKNTSRLIQLSRLGRTGEKKEDVLYLGPPAFLHHTVSLTSYTPKYAALSLSLPNTIEVYCDYIVKFSGALAVLNMVPVHYLDGYWIFGALIDLLLASRCDQITRKIVHAIITMLGSMLLLLNIVFGILSIL